MYVAAGEILSINIITTPVTHFVVQKVVVEETLSEPYVVDVFVSTTALGFDGESLIFKPAIVVFDVYDAMSPGSPKAARAFHGLITHMEHLRTIADESMHITNFFHFQIRPVLWMLKHGRDHRIFQQKSALDIIQTIFDENGITDFDVKSDAGKTEREFCVQYGETHFDFVSRLLEEEGIGYYFKHTSEGHTMVLFDQNTKFMDISQKELMFSTIENDRELHIDRVFSFGKKSQIASNAYDALDFNYLTPSKKLHATSSGPGFGGKVYEYPGLFNKADAGNALVDKRMEEIEWFTKRVRGSSTCSSLSPGFTFALKGHPIPEYNKPYAIYSVRHEIISQSEDLHGTEPLKITYTNSFEGFLKVINYRPHRKTTKPRIYGSQTAFVTGSGKEVYGDEMARIKIKFHWDLRNADDETSSLWVRVSQSLSGATWGALYMPRIGMEVVVAFIDGDPDRPLVTGCVYNQAFMPPYSPKDHPHFMSLKSKSFDDDAGNNELRFSDKNGEEEIYLHGQYDMNTVIGHSRTEKINTGDDKLTIVKGNKTIEQQGSGTTYLTLINGGDKITQLKNGNLVIDVTGTVLIKATQDITIKTPTNIMLQAGQNIMMQAGQNIQSKADMLIQEEAGSSIETKAGGIIQTTSKGMILQSKGVYSLTAQTVKLSAETALQASSGAAMKISAGAMLTAEGGAMAMVKGAITKLGS